MFAARRALSGAAQRRAFSATARDVSCTFDIPRAISRSTDRGMGESIVDRRENDGIADRQDCLCISGDANCLICVGRAVGGLMHCPGRVQDINTIVLVDQLLILYFPVVQSYSFGSCWWNWTASVSSLEVEPPRHRARSLRWKSVV